MIQRAFLNSSTLAWIVLMAVTAVSWWLGTDHGMTPTAPESEQNWNQVTVFVLGWLL